MEAREYMVKEVKLWTDQEGNDIEDNYGNKKLSVTLTDVGEPVDFTAKNLPERGKAEYGVVEEYKTKAGNTRLKFVRKQREDAPQGAVVGGKSGYQKSPAEQDSIFRCNALTNASVIVSSQSTGKTAEAVLDVADKLYNWLKGAPFGMSDEEMASLEEEMPPDFLQYKG